MMKTKIRKWGNSLAVRIPKPLAERAGIHDGSPARLRVDDEGRLVVDPRKPADYALDALLEDVTEGNLHDEVSDGGSLGREAW